MPKIEIGVQLRPQHTSIEEYRRAWQRADELGVDIIFNWDHFFPLSGDPNGNHFEAWTTLAVFGAATKRARVSCLVLSMSYRNPALLSNMAKTLDHITGGRLILGVGAGWNERDYDEFGYEFGTAGDRLRNLERGLAIIRDRWSKDPPKPVNGTIPILVGGGGEKVTLRIVAKHADIWHSHGPVERWAPKNRILDEWCRKVGRDPSQIQRAVSVGDDDVDNPQPLVDAGATLLTYGLGHPFDFAPIEKLLAFSARAASSG